MGSKDEVVVYGEQERPKEVIPLKKSVKAQIHSLETKGRHHRVINTEQDNKRSGSNNGSSTFTKNPTTRSRSENPPKSRFLSLAPTLEDDFASRVNLDSRQVTSTNKNPPPPMPEKTKIHLKNDQNSLNSRTSNSNQKQAKAKPTREITSAANRKANNAAKNNNLRSSRETTNQNHDGRRSRRPDQPLPELPSIEPTSMQSSHPYDSIPVDDNSGSRKSSSRSREVQETKAQQYRRSKSLGPVVEAAQKELLASKVAIPRSRSRGPMTPDNRTPDRDVRRSRSRGRMEAEDMAEESRIMMNNNRPKAYKKDSGSLESSRGRQSKMKSVERSMSSSKTPMEIMPKSGAGPLPGGSGHPGRMPARQKSMIDLRDPSWDHQPPPRHHLMHQGSRQQQQQQQQPPMPRHLASGGHSSPQNLQPLPHAGVANIHHRPAMVRSATEHDIKIRNRRSMAVGPFEDLPPHIRQHMVSLHHFFPEPS
jgi:hypothetical protein